MLRRFATLTLSMAAVLGLGFAGLRAAQDDKKAEAGQAKPEDKDAKAPEKPQDAAKPEGDADTKADSAAKAETPLPMQTLTPGASIPPEVQAKLEAARKAVAEAVVAAQDAGLVDTTASPPPILDILLLGKVDDKATLQQVVGKDAEAGVSLEVFGAWYTGYAKLDGVVPEKNVRIVPPSQGLKAYYDARAQVFNKYISEARAAQPAAGEATKPEAESKPEEATKPEAEPKPEGETKPEAEAKPEGETKPEAEPKPEGETKPEAEPAPEGGSEPKPEAEPAPEGEPKPEGGEPKGDGRA
jgi:hypothetical protein